MREGRWADAYIGRTQYNEFAPMRCGGMAERFKAAVLKTVERETVPGVRIPLPPPTPTESVCFAVVHLEQRGGVPQVPLARDGVNNHTSSGASSAANARPAPTPACPEMREAHEEVR